MQDEDLFSRPLNDAPNPLCQLHHCLLPPDVNVLKNILIGKMNVFREISAIRK